MLREVADSTGLSPQVTAALADTSRGPRIHLPGDVFADLAAGVAAGAACVDGVGQSCGDREHVFTWAASRTTLGGWSTSARCGQEPSCCVYWPRRPGCRCRRRRVGAVHQGAQPGQALDADRIVHRVAVHPNHLFEIDTTPFEGLASLRRGRFCRSRASRRTGPVDAADVFGPFWNWLRPRGKRQRDCIDCSAPVKIPRPRALLWVMRRLRERASKTHCPACGRERVLVSGSAAAAGSAFL